MFSSVLDLTVFVLSEDRFLTTLSSQSSTGSTHLQLPTPPEVVSEQLTGAGTLSEQDTTSSSEGIVPLWYCIPSLHFLWQVYKIYAENGKCGNVSLFQMCLMDTHWDLQTAK